MAKYDETRSPYITTIGGWLGWIILISILPLIGSIIMSFAPKDESTKNYGRLVLIAQLILAAIGVLLFVFVGPQFFLEIAQQYGVSV